MCPRNYEEEDFKTENLLPPPPGWGKDDLTDFCQKAYENGFYSFVHFRDWVDRLIKVDAAFSKGTKSLNNSPDYFSGFFFMKARSAFLGASRLNLSGQLPEGYMLLRACIENGLYGFKVWKDTNSQEIWLRRHDDNKTDRKSKMACRSVFSYQALLRLIKFCDKPLAGKISNLYEHAIDYGAHPNERALSSSIEVTDAGKGGRRYDVHSFNIHKTARELAFKSTARVGVCVLMLFKHVFQTRFDLIGLSEEINNLRNGL